ncbi:MAG: SurA N-terminal domain-containing protein [Thermodesulfobacteriota bacterium]
MSEQKSVFSKRSATVIFSAAAAVVLIVVFGYETFSRDRNGQVNISEYRKEGLPPGAAVNASGGRDAAGPTGMTAPRKISPDAAKAVMSVQRLSCSSCIQEIKAALSGIQGIEEVLVDISRGTAQVYYNGKNLTDPQRIAQAITARGYPATLIKLSSPEELRKEEAVAAARSQVYIASVDGWDIARSDLDTQMEHAKKKYARIYGEGVFSSLRGKALIDNLRAQIASRLIDEGVMMQEITKAGYKVDPAEVETEFERVVRESGKGLEEFKASLNENGMTLDYFRKRVETQVLVNRYLEENVLAAASSEAERQNLFTSWFSNAKTLAEVSFYDKDLEALVQQQAARGSCGG